MRRYRIFIFLLLQYQEVFGIFQVKNIIKFLTSNVISATQFDFVFISEPCPADWIPYNIAEDMTNSVAFVPLSKQLNVLEELQQQYIAWEDSENEINFRIFIFNVTQQKELAHEQLASILSTISSLQFKSKFMFIILWPTWLDHNVEIPKLLPLQQRLNNSTAAMNPSPFIDLASDVYLLHDQAAICPEFLLTELYQIKSYSPFIQQNITADTTENVTLSQDSLIIYELLRKAHRRSDFQGVEILGVAENDTDFEFEASMNVSKPSNEPKFVSGEAVGIYRNLRDATNFKEKAVVGTGYAFLYDNGSLNGMGAQVANGEADISISFSEIVLYRVEHVTFLHPVSDEKLYVYFRQPASNAFRDIYLHAFSPTLWLVYLILWFVLCASVMLFVWIKKHIQNLNVEEDSVLIYEFAIWAVASIAQQGWYSVPRSISVAIVALTGMMTAFILYTAFCGSLVSILSLPVLAITSFQNILDKQFTIYGEHLTIAVTDLIKNLDKHGVGRFEDNPLLNPHEAMSKLLTDPNSAFISPVYAFYLPLFRSECYNETIVCNMISGIALGGSPAKAGMFVRKGSAFKEIFNAKILHLIETGIRRRLIRHYKEQASFTCMKEDEATTPKDPMEIKDVFTAIAILIMGFILSGFIFLIEKLLQYLKSHESNLTKPRFKLACL